MGEWVTAGFGTGVGRLRSAAVYRASMHARHLNRGTTWRPNDLVDLVYLSCAAAYADVVVAEGHMSGVLRQALRGLSRTTPVLGRLRDAVPAVEALLPPA